MQTKKKQGPKSVAIIGGGMCGLFCGYYLSKAGFKVTIFEKKDVLGGFLATIKHENILFEKYYHHIFKNDFELINLLDELELSRKLIWRKGISANFVNQKLLPSNSFFDWLRFPEVKLIDKLISAKSRSVFTKKNASTYHSISAYELITIFFGLSFFNNFWKPLFEKKFSSEASNISAAWFISRLQKRFKNGKSQDKCLGYMDGSFQVLIDKLQEIILQKGGKFELSNTINNVTKTGQKYIVNESKFEYLISTIAKPSNALTNILEKRELNSQSNIKYYGIICASILSTKKLSDFYWVNILDKKIPFVSFVEQTNLFDYKKDNFHLSYLGWYLSQKELRNRNKKELEVIVRKTVKKMFPNHKGKLIINISIDKYAQPIIPAKIKVPTINSSDKNVFITNMAHIFPQDRGLNEALIEGLKISKLIS